jgi:hypothetical protein
MRTTFDPFFTWLLYDNNNRHDYNGILLRVFRLALMPVEKGGCECMSFELGLLVIRYTDSIESFDCFICGSALNVND